MRSCRMGERQQEPTTGCRRCSGVMVRKGSDNHLKLSRPLAFQAPSVPGIFQRACGRDVLEHLAHSKRHVTYRHTCHIGDIDGV